MGLFYNIISACLGIVIFAALDFVARENKFWILFLFLKLTQ